MTLPPPVVPVRPAPAPVPAPALPADATSGGLAFHRLVFARRRSGWWTPLAVAGLALAFYMVFIIVSMIAFAIVTFADTTILDRLAAMASNPTFDMTDPVMIALMLGTIALMLPAYVLASLIVNGRRLGLISSAAGRLRWKWMLLCGAVAVVWSAVLIALSLLVPGETGEAGLSPAENPMWVASLIVVLLLVPVQAAAEEYIFRGMLMQSIGRWLRHPAWAILLPVPLFVFGHLYDVIGLVSVGVFAVAAGWMTWRTGGLEAAIALHVVNNLTAFGLQLAGGEEAAANSPGLLSLVFSCLLVGGFVAFVEWWLRRHPMPRTLVLTPPPAPPVLPAPQWQPPVYAAP